MIVCMCVCRLNYGCVCALKLKTITFKWLLKLVQRILNNTRYVNKERCTISVVNKELMLLIK